MAKRARMEAGYNTSSTSLGVAEGDEKETNACK
jgi:hypothetical protein